MYNQYTLFHCYLCRSSISKDTYWMQYGRSQIMVHYHCAAQFHDHGNVQLQFFDLEKYLDV